MKKEIRVFFGNCILPKEDLVSYFTLRTGLIVILFVLFTDSVNCQSLQWERIYGGGDEDIGYSIVETHDGGILGVGSTKSFGEGSNDVYLIRLSASGDSIWTRTYGTFLADEGFDVKLTEDSGFAVAGYSKSSGGGKDLYLLKIDKDGAKEWDKTYGGILEDGSYSLQQTSDEGFILAGYTSSTGSGENDAVLIKVNESGDVQWTNEYGGLYDEFGYSVIETTDLGYLLAGGTESSGAGGFDAYLIKTSSTGDITWEKTYGTIENEVAYGLGQTKDSAAYFVICEQSTGSGQNNLLFFKVDLNGDSLFFNIYRGTDLHAKSVIESYDDGFLISGSSGTISSDIDLLLIRTNDWGDSLWAERKDDVYHEDAISSIVTTDSVLVTIGKVKKNSSDDYDVLITTYPLGCGFWRDRTLELRNLWCPGTNDYCYPWLQCDPNNAITLNFPKVLNLNPLPGTNLEADLLNYIRDYRFHNISIARLEYILDEDCAPRDNPTSTTIVDTDGDPTSGKQLRQKLMTLLWLMKHQYRVDHISALMSIFEAEQTLSDYDELLEFMIRFDAFNNPNIGYDFDNNSATVPEFYANHTEFDAFVVDYEFWRPMFGCDEVGWNTNCVSALNGDLNGYCNGCQSNFGVIENYYKNVLNKTNALIDLYPFTLTGFAQFDEITTEALDLRAPSGRMGSIGVLFGRVERDVNSTLPGTDKEYLGDYLADNYDDIYHFWYMLDTRYTQSPPVPPDNFIHNQAIHQVVSVNEFSTLDPATAPRYHAYFSPEGVFDRTPGTCPQSPTQWGRNYLYNYMTADANGPWSSNGEVYLPEIENTFLDQWLTGSGGHHFSSNVRSGLELSSFAWFWYQMMPLDGSRLKDRLPNYYTDCHGNSSRMSGNSFDMSSDKITAKQHEEYSDYSQILYNNSTLQLKLPNAFMNSSDMTYRILNSLGQEVISRTNSNMEQEGSVITVQFAHGQLEPGVYIIEAHSRDIGRFARGRIVHAE
ncbi:MAG: hypothetical protein HKN22_02705 [Bacteroidia bacterium]|nr:hypothetical protein [Bacteroidia bacterium]